ncbi:hypothetical protein BS47DRAFT_1336465, partial [Hydnum rufescens UP504]
MTSEELRRWLRDHVEAKAMKMCPNLKHDVNGHPVLCAVSLVFKCQKKPIGIEC